MSIEEDPRSFNFILKIEALKLDVQQKITITDVKEIYKVLGPLTQKMGDILGKFSCRQEPTLPVALSAYPRSQISELTIQAVLASIKASEKKLITIAEICNDTKISRGSVDFALTVLMQRGQVKRERLPHNAFGYFCVQPTAKPSVKVEDATAKKLREEAEKSRIKKNAARFDSK